MQRNTHYGEIAWKVLNISDKGDHFISIGCGSGRLDYGDFKGLSHIKDDEKRWTEFEKIYEKMMGKEKCRIRYSLYRFLFEYKAGDYIIVPDIGKIHIFQIESHKDDKIYYYTEIEEYLKDREVNTKEILKDDFKYFIKLKPIKLNIPRKYILSPLSSRLKYRGTSLNLNDLKGQIENLLEMDIVNGISLYDKLSKNQFIIKGICDELSTLNEIQFEKLVRWYFRQIGADDVFIPSKNYSDKVGKEDVDVIAYFENLKVQFCVQVKNYNIGLAELDGAVKQIEEYINKHESKENDYTVIGWVVSNSKEENVVTKNLKDNIRIIAVEELAEMLLNVGIDRTIDQIYER